MKISIKWLQREIVLSSTYRQTSQATEQGLSIDPANKFLARMNHKRLSVEGWRDAVLTAAGTLSSIIGGESIDPQTPDERRRLGRYALIGAGLDELADPKAARIARGKLGR